MVWWIWVLIGFALLAVEFATTTMHVGFFAVGAFVVAILVGFGVPMSLWVQILVFVIATMLAFFFLRPLLMQKLRLNEKKVVDSLVGEKAIALQDIPVGESGKAEMRGTSWSARNVGETGLIAGQRCVVADVEGLVIHVRAS
ncbi:MAG: NfeD family protein [Acidobacteriota bacterium]|nr:NfeD family protein [Acidobacteriota bacterium]